MLRIGSSVTPHPHLDDRRDCLAFGPDWISDALGVPARTVCVAPLVSRFTGDGLENGCRARFSPLEVEPAGPGVPSSLPAAAECGPLRKLKGRPGTSPCARERVGDDTLPVVLA